MSKCITWSTKILGSSSVPCFHRLWHCFSVCQCGKEDCMESVGDTWWTHRSSLSGTQCTRRNIRGNRIFPRVFHHPFLRQGSDLHRSLSTTWGSFYSHAKDVRCQPSPHQGCTAATLLGGQYCKVVFIGDVLLRHIAICHPQPNGDGPARNSGGQCGHICQKQVPLVQSYWNANVGVGVKTATVWEHISDVLPTAHVGEIVTMHKSLTWLKSKVCCFSKTVDEL